MRSLKSIYTIPAHKSAVSDLKFFHAPRSSPSSYPTTTLPRAFSPLEPFAAKLANDDVSGDKMIEDEVEADVPLSGSFLVSGGYDGVVKVWSADDWQQIKSMTSDASGKVMSVDVSSGAS
jgi:U4/U6 small nuclear ribonucleoprotein PRP4